MAKGAQTRQALLDAAVVRFGRDGFRATSVAEIGRDASVSGTAAYAYFPNKEALFLAALDQDAAALVHEGLTTVLADPDVPDWRRKLLFTLVEAVERHPLARRLLGGLEPEVTDRVLEIPALADLRKACAERLRVEQLGGTVRPDVDAVTMANGVTTLILSLLMSLVQLGSETASAYADDVAAVIQAALAPVPPPTER
jgi:AcrR family transcriptional regulator